MRKLIAVGTGTGLSVKGRGGSCFLVDCDRQMIMLDCGEGAAAWSTDLKFVSALRAIFVSHFHSDHFSGFFQIMQNLTLEGRDSPLDVYIPESGIEPVRLMLETIYLDKILVNHTLNDNTGWLILNPMEDEISLKNSSFKIECWDSDHFKDDKLRMLDQRSAFGFTVDCDGHRLIYTSDISTIDCLKENLYSEATLICDGLHVSQEEVYDLGIKRNLRRIIFTHYENKLLSESEKLNSESMDVIFASDGMEIEW